MALAVHPTHTGRHASPPSSPTPASPPSSKTILKAPQAFWGTGIPLSEAAATFLAGPGAIASTDNRYLTLTGCVPDHCPQRGLLWLDLGRTHPLLVFAASNWNEQATPPTSPRPLHPLALPQP